MMAIDNARDPVCSRKTYEKASQRLYDCFHINGGPYIKMGQMIDQMGQLVPSEYSSKIEAICTNFLHPAIPEVEQIVK